MFVGFRINHIARILEAVVAVVTLGGLLTPGGRAVAKGLAKGAAVTAKEAINHGERVGNSNAS